MKPIILVIFIFVLTSTNSANGAVAQTRELPTLNYCELVQNADAYNGKLVRVRGTYSSWFEHSGLNCSDCPDSTWCDFSFDMCPKSKKLKAEIVNVIFVGIFKTAGHYGHLNGYHHQLDVSCVEFAQSISKNYLVSNKKKKAIAEKTRCH
jgi:hypothetical protein